jgi:hypothetical protein
MDNGENRRSVGVVSKSTISQESAMLYVEITSSAFPETYAFATDSRKHAGEYIAFLISVGMIPRVLLTVNFSQQ